MTKREKVLAGLAICLPETPDEGMINCAACPYIDQCDESVMMPVRLLEDAREALRTPPTVVHCVDCKHCLALTEEDPLPPYDGGAWWYCEKSDTEYHVTCRDPERFYCADGEEREGEKWQ